MPGPLMRRPAPIDVAALASRAPEPLRQPAGTLLQLLADALGADTVANPATLDVAQMGPAAPLAAVQRGTLLELAKPVGSLAKGVKATRVPGVYQLRDQVVERLAQLYRHGLQLPTEANWEAMTDELRAAAGGRAGATQWGRLWGATSPNTAVPRNTSESLAAQLHQVERPGELMTLEWAQTPGPTKITMAPSKVPNINRVYQGEPLSGDKAEAMAAFMAGDPRLPIDVHAVWALGSKGDKLQPELSGLRALMTRAEGLPARGGLTDTDIYLRYEQALRDALAQIEPARNVGGTFATMWEGTRSAKGLRYQGGPLDLLKRAGLLEAGALLDRDRLRQTLSQKGWTAGAIAGLLAALPSVSPDEAR